MDQEKTNISDTQSNLKDLISKIDEKIEEIKSLPELDNEETADDIHDILNYIHEHPENLKAIKDMIKNTNN